MINPDLAGPKFVQFFGPVIDAQNGNSLSRCFWGEGRSQRRKPILPFLSFEMNHQGVQPCMTWDAHIGPRVLTGAEAAAYFPFALLKQRIAEEIKLAKKIGIDLLG